MNDPIAAALGNVAIPIPSSGSPDKALNIEPAAAPDEEYNPDFDTTRKRRGKGRGRRTVPPEPPAQERTLDPAAGMSTDLTPTEMEQIAKALGVGFRVVFAMVAMNRGQHWQIAPADEQLLGAAWAEAFRPWLLTSAKYVPLAMAALVTIGVVVPRIDADAKLNPAPEPAPNADTPRQASVTNGKADNAKA